MGYIYTVYLYLFCKKFSGVVSYLHKLLRLVGFAENRKLHQKEDGTFLQFYLVVQWIFHADLTQCLKTSSC